MGQLRDGDQILDDNKVRWNIRTGGGFPDPALEATVDPTSPRVYGVSFDPDTAPVITVSTIPLTTSKERMLERVNAFAKSSKDDIILRVTASPDKPSDGAALLLLLLALVFLEK
jgi:hypothetical protein